MGTWVFMNTGSVTEYSMIGLVAVAPQLLLLPVSGMLADRISRKFLLMISTAVPALSMFLAGVLCHRGQLGLGVVLAVCFLDATAASFYTPAFSASVTLLVPKRHYGRATAMSDLGAAVASIAAPLLGGLLLARTSMTTILMFDAATFLVLLAALAVCRIPMPAQASADRPRSRSRWSDLWFGFHYIAERRGLLGLVLYFALTNFSMSFAVTMLAPLLLRRSTPAVLGVVLSVAGAGMMAGSLVMSVWGGPRRKTALLFVGNAVVGAALVVGALVPSVITLGACAFVVMFSSPAVNMASQVIWRTKVPPALQGRVFAVRMAIAMSSMPLAYLVAGPLADALFEPVMRDGTALSRAFGPAFGTGPGRGMALMVLIAGLVTAAATAVAWANPRIRRVETELGDVVMEGSES